jgi:hypothetical protein
MEVAGAAEMTALIEVAADAAPVAPILTGERRNGTEICMGVLALPLLLACRDPLLLLCV